MNRQDAEQLALAYCLRNIDATQAAEPGTTRPHAEHLVLSEAVSRYRSGLTRTAIGRIQKQLKAARP